jgi:hypothetical protein
MTSGQRSSQQLRIPGLLGTAAQIALIALKLAGIIDWSWWWVLVPFWGSILMYSAGYPRSVTSGQRSSWQLRIPGQLPLAAIPLIALKLAGIIGWSWWWVLAPLWGSVGIFVALIGGPLLLLTRSQRPRI